MRVFVIGAGSAGITTAKHLTIVIGKYYQRD